MLPEYYFIVIQCEFGLKKLMKLGFYFQEFNRRMILSNQHSQTLDLCMYGVLY
jgi:hypothetical protein